MKRIGYTFSDPALLKTALTHPSHGGPDNQRLEFLGDAVLQYLMSERLYLAYPGEREGGLTHRRAKLVCEAALSGIARHIGLGACLKMDRGEELTGGRDKNSILADAVEALLAAVYLDGGVESARRLCLKLWPNLEELNALSEDHKGALQEYLQARGLPTPVYELIGMDGPPHERVFQAAVFSQNRPLASGVGKSKKQAEQEAAAAALAALLSGEGEST